MVLSHVLQIKLLPHSTLHVSLCRVSKHHNSNLLKIASQWFSNEFLRLNCNAFCFIFVNRSGSCVKYSPLSDCLCADGNERCSWLWKICDKKGKKRETTKKYIAPQIYDPFLATARVLALLSVIHHNAKRKRMEFMLRAEICISQHYSNSTDQIKITDAVVIKR